MKKNLENQFIGDYLKELIKTLENIDKKKIINITNLIHKAYLKNKKVFIIGNGGSASTASHMASDLGKGTLKRVYDEKEKRLKVYSLTDNAALLTAYGNDLSFDDIFVQQLRNLVEKGDVVIALSGSGNSKNIIKAVKYARRCGAVTIGILGFGNGGKLGSLADYSIITNSTNYGICEDVTLVIDHLITGLLSKRK